MAAPTPRPTGTSRRRPATPPDPAVQQRAWTAMGLGLLSLLALFLGSGLQHPIYVVAATLVIGGLAAWLGGTAVSRARKGRTGRPAGAVAGIVLGLLGLAFSGLTLIVFAVFWNQLSTYRNCSNAANTVTAQQACQHQLNQTISNEFGSFTPRG